MKLRLGNVISKQYWFIIFVAALGGGVIYFLNSIGVIEAMRNDNTLDYLYEANVKLPKAPFKKKTPGTTGYIGEDVRIQSANLSLREFEIALIDTIINSNNEDTTKSSKLDKKSQKHGDPLIPHIIHQTWDSYQIPKTFIDNINSWVDHHPAWEYWFWTSKAIKCFLEKYYSQYVSVYNSYSSSLSRADAMRYFVLHKYGGVYVDLDTECLKSLDIWTYNFCCILTEEPYEHSFIVRESNSSSIVNSPMACKSNHKLFERAIRLLPEYATKFFWDYKQSPGPVFLANVYKQYLTELHTDTIGNACTVTITPPKYFLPRFDPSQNKIIDGRCSLRTYKSLPEAQMKVCENLIDRNYENLVTETAFMDHTWLHAARLGQNWKHTNTVNFFNILPKAKNLEHMFCNS